MKNASILQSQMRSESNQNSQNQSRVGAEQFQVSHDYMDNEQNELEPQYELHKSSKQAAGKQITGRLSVRSSHQKSLLHSKESSQIVNLPQIKQPSNLNSQNQSISHKRQTLMRKENSQSISQDENKKLIDILKSRKGSQVIQDDQRYALNTIEYEGKTANQQSTSFLIRNLQESKSCASFNLNQKDLSKLPRNQSTIQMIQRHLEQNGITSKQELFNPFDINQLQGKHQKILQDLPVKKQTLLNDLSKNQSKSPRVQSYKQLNQQLHLKGSSMCGLSTNGFKIANSNQSPNIGQEKVSKLNRNINYQHENQQEVLKIERLSDLQLYTLDLSTLVKSKKECQTTGAVSPSHHLVQRCINIRKIKKISRLNNRSQLRSSHDKSFNGQASITHTPLDQSQILTVGQKINHLFEKKKDILPRLTKASRDKSLDQKDFKFQSSKADQILQVDEDLIQDFDPSLSKHDSSQQNQIIKEKNIQHHQPKIEEQPLQPSYNEKLFNHVKNKQQKARQQKLKKQQQESMKDKKIAERNKDLDFISQVYFNQPAFQNSTKTHTFHKYGYSDASQSKLSNCHKSPIPQNQISQSARLSVEKYESKNTLLKNQIEKNTEKLSSNKVLQNIQKCNNMKLQAKNQIQINQDVMDIQS
eukprot:403340761